MTGAHSVRPHAAAPETLNIRISINSEFVGNFVYIYIYISNLNKFGLYKLFYR
jgi:hypothetical protein